MSSILIASVSLKPVSSSLWSSDDPRVCLCGRHFHDSQRLPQRCRDLQIQSQATVQSSLSPFTYLGLKVLRGHLVFHLARMIRALIWWMFPEFLLSLRHLRQHPLTPSVKSGAAAEIFYFLLRCCPRSLDFRRGFFFNYWILMFFSCYSRQACSCFPVAWVPCEGASECWVVHWPISLFMLLKYFQVGQVRLWKH